MFRYPMLVSSLALLLTACAGGPERVATADIEPKVRVVSTAGVGTEVTVVLYRAPLATYRLQPGERLTVTHADSEPVVMMPGTDLSSWLRRNAYLAKLPEIAAGEELVIAFERPGEDGAPNTLVRVPGEIAVTRPAAGDRRTLGESFTVAWEPLGGGQVEVRFAVDSCEGLDQEAIADLRIERGFVDLSLADGDLGLTNATFAAPARAERCRVDLLVGRTSDDIALDSAFGELRPASRSVRVSEVVPLTFTEAPSLPTADIEPKVRVVSTAGVGTEVTVVLYRAGLLPGGTYQLAVGERLTVTTERGEPVSMTPAPDRSTPAQPAGYRAVLPEVAPGETIVIALERAGDDAAPNTVVRVPNDIGVTRPTAGERRVIGEAFTVEWEPLATGQVEVRFDVTACDGLDADEFDGLQATRGYPLPLRAGDAGSSTVTFAAPQEATRCTADLLVGRTSEAIELDPSFRGLRVASRAVRVSGPIPLEFAAEVP